VIHGEVDLAVETLGQRAVRGALDGVAKAWRAAEADRNVQRLGVSGLLEHAVHRAEERLDVRVLVVHRAAVDAREEPLADVARVGIELLALDLAELLERLVGAARQEDGWELISLTVCGHTYRTKSRCVLKRSFLRLFPFHELMCSCRGLS